MIRADAEQVKSGNSQHSYVQTARNSLNVITDKAAAAVHINFPRASVTAECSTTVKAINRRRGFAGRGGLEVPSSSFDIVEVHSLVNSGLSNRQLNDCSCRYYQ